MTKSEKQLWEKITQFNFNDEDNDFTFVDRLARENNWTHDYAKKVVEEYKKFLFLCSITTTGVTPSDQVDQAWHLHLTYTKSYWIDLCENTLEKEIHHNPTKGGTSEAIKFDTFYSKTKEDYKAIFEVEPPLKIWPNNENRFSDIHFKRINKARNWIIKKPILKQKSIATTSIITLLSLFLIQATFLNHQLLVILFFVAIIVVLGYFSNKNNKNGGSGCSAGCASGCSTDSGHGGCSSGCGGCGGGD